MATILGGLDKHSVVLRLMIFAQEVNIQKRQEPVYLLKVSDAEDIT